MNRIKALYPYQGREISGWQAYKLPECEVCKSEVYIRLKRGEPVEVAIKQKPKKKPEPKVIEAPKKKPPEEVKDPIPEEEKNKLVKIFSVPINPNKCRYTASGMALFTEVQKGGFFE